MAANTTLQQKMPTPASYTQEEVLRFIMVRDNLSLDGVVSEMRKAQGEKIILSHPYKIFLGKDGRYHTCLKDDSKKDGRRHIAKTTLESLHDAIVEHYKSQEEHNKPEEPTIEILYPKWLEYKKLHTNADSYIYRIMTEWKKYYEGTPITKIPVVKLTRLALDEWAHRLIKDNNMTKKQYYNTTVIMRQVLEYAFDLEIIDSNPFSRVKIDGARMFRRVSKPASESQVFTAEELELMHDLAWKAFHDRRNHKHQLIPLAFMFFFQTGLRISEICTIRYEDIENNELHIQRMYCHYEHSVKDRTKGYYGDRYVPLTDDAVRLIEAAKDRQKTEGVSTTGYIFSMTDDPVPYTELRKTFYKYCEDVGLLPRSSHKSRKTVVSTLIDNGVNINTIREMMGHLDERTTYNNYCFDRKDKSARRQLISQSLCRNTG